MLKGSEWQQMAEQFLHLFDSKCLSSLENVTEEAPFTGTLDVFSYPVSILAEDVLFKLRCSGATGTSVIQAEAIRKSALQSEALACSDVQDLPRDATIAECDEGTLSGDVNNLPRNAINIDQV